MPIWGAALLRAVPGRISDDGLIRFIVISLHGSRAIWDASLLRAVPSGTTVDGRIWLIEKSLHCSRPILTTMSSNADADDKQNKTTGDSYLDTLRPLDKLV